MNTENNLPTPEEKDKNFFADLFLNYKHRKEMIEKGEANLRSQERQFQQDLEKERAEHSLRLKEERNKHTELLNAATETHALQLNKAFEKNTEQLNDALKIHTNQLNEESETRRKLLDKEREEFEKDYSAKQEKLRKEISELQDERNKLEKEKDEFEREQEYFSAKLDRAKTSLRNEYEDRVDALESNNSRLENNAKEHRAEMSGLEGKLGDLEYLQDRVDGRTMVDLYNKTTALTEELDLVKGERDARPDALQESKYEDIQGENDKLKKELNEYLPKMHKLDDLEETERARDKAEEKVTKLEQENHELIKATEVLHKEETVWKEAEKEYKDKEIETDRALTDKDNKIESYQAQKELDDIITEGYKAELERLRTPSAEEVEKQKADRLQAIVENPQIETPMETSRLIKMEAGEKLLQAQIREELDKLSKEELDKLSKEELAKLRKEKLAKLGEEKLAKLSKEELDKLRKEKLAKLGEEKLDKLSKEELDKLGEEELLDRLNKKVSQDRVSQEREWLEQIGKDIKDLGYKFSPRMLKSFHTSLKSADLSSLTVLSGVSGTGKSLLPRLYATFGGINFISVPVQPNWDSPETMLGYFNALDNKFDAQDILKFLIQHQKSEYLASLPENLKERLLGEQMGLILLDEMNLAHPELYFADFLSALEERRTTGVPSLGIKLGTGITHPLKIDRNILWTGTMNQDETTKSLSDKVVDRSIIINFPRPEKLEPFTEIKKIIPAEHFLPRNVWASWIERKSLFSEDRTLIAPYIDILNTINGELGVINGRALGHRISHSVEYYISNHLDVREHFYNNDEDKLKAAIKIAFEDQLAQKVMPKLNGMEVDGPVKTALDAIGELFKDYPIYDDYKAARDNSDGYFNFNSGKFLNVEKTPSDDTTENTDSETNISE